MREGDIVNIERDGLRLTIERPEMATLDEMLATVSETQPEFRTGPARGAEDFD